jgi:hypothetical protein
MKNTNIKSKKSIVSLINQDSDAKIHWKMSPNTNYLGHQDLIDGKDVILEIARAGYEFVENPKITIKDENGKSKPTVEEKRVIHFVETPKNKLWLKPWICNETNAEMIMKATNTKFMKDSIGKKIQIGISTVKVKSEQVDCLRVREVYSTELEAKNYISNEQINDLKNTLNQLGDFFTEQQMLTLLKLDFIEQMPLEKFDAVKKSLNTKLQQKTQNMQYENN